MDRPHFHESVEFLMPVSRGGEMFVENQVYSLHPAALFILPDATLHKTLASEPYERYVLHVPIPTLHALSAPQTDFYRRIQEAERMVEMGGRYNELLSLLKRLDWEQGRKSTEFGSDLSQMLLLSEFLLQALSIAPARRQADELCQIESPPLPGAREGTLKISAVLEYLQAHLSEKLTLERVASEFFISKYYLSHCFKEATGFSVMAEMQRRFTKDLGVPCAGFDGDQADPRNFNEAQYETRVQGLVEAMEENKKLKEARA